MKIFSPACEKTWQVIRGSRLARAALMTMALSFDATAQVQIAVEYHHKGWDHYFVTASPSEIALLDRGAFNGAWTRTGQTFPVWGKAVEGAQQTCRFFSTTFDPRSSHFYTPFSDECSAVSANKDWQSEGIAFYIKPASADGSCPAGMAALYRFYNNGAGGAPNHRYTASETTAAQMRSAGWTQEGSGASGAFACVPRANPSDDGDRVIVYVQDGTAPTVPAANDWVIRYSYRVPPMPGKTWDPNQQTFYIWGDVDFDAYGSEGAYAMSGYRFNQISPQLSIGRSLVSNDAGYAPGWQTITSWVVQAQYFWQKGETPFALAGEIVHVSPGELIETEIAFSAVTGHIVATITAPGGRSSIDIPRPFPNEPSLFADWKDFFRRAAQKSRGVVYATPAMQVEPYFVDIQTQCSILPFHIDLISLPGVPATTASFTYQSLGTVTCPTDLARLAF